MTSLNSNVSSNNLISVSPVSTSSHSNGVLNNNNNNGNNTISSIASSPSMGGHSNGHGSLNNNSIISTSSPNAFSPPLTQNSSPPNNISNLRQIDQPQKIVRSQSEEFKGSILPTSDSKKKVVISPKILAPKKSTLEPSDEPPISKTLEGRLKSNPYIKKFKLPSSEILLNDYSAALYRQILLHGRLYLFTNYICFESKIFGIKTTEIVQIKDITSIKKKSKKFKFIGVEIETTNNKLSFASFVSRDKTYHDLISAWKDVTGESHDDASSQSIDDDIEEEGHSVQFEDDKQLVSQQSLLPTQMDLNPQHQANNNTNPETINIEQLSSTITTTTTTTTNTTTIISNSENNNQPTEQKQEQENVPLPKSPLDEIYGTVEQYLSKNEPEKSLLESQHSEFQELLSENFNVSVVNFYRALCSDKCNFAFNYHTKRGDSSITVKNWTERERFGTIRELEYVAPVNSPIGPDKTRIQETQRYHLVKSKLILETDTIMLDIPYGDHFRIEAKWEISETSPDTCKLNIHLCVRFIKKTWFKSKIESGTIKESKASFTQWVTLAKLELQKLLAIKPIINNSPTNINGPPTIIVNKNIENTRLKDDDHSSPKPHHTRSRSRQHLITSSGQVHNNANHPGSSPLSGNIVTTTTPTSLSSSLVQPINFSNSASNRELLPQTTIEQVNEIKSTTSIFKNNNQEKKESSFRFKTPIGTISLSSPIPLPFLITILIGCLLLLHMYIKILTLSSKVETMENIFKDLINNNINNDKNLLPHYHKKH